MCPKERKARTVEILRELIRPVHRQKEKRKRGGKGEQRGLSQFFCPLERKRGGDEPPGELLNGDDQQKSYESRSILARGERKKKRGEGGIPVISLD